MVSAISEIASAYIDIAFYLPKPYCGAEEPVLFLTDTSHGHGDDRYMRAALGACGIDASARHIYLSLAHARLANARDIPWTLFPVLLDLNIRHDADMSGVTWPAGRGYLEMVSGNLAMHTLGRAVIDVSHPLPDARSAALAMQRKIALGLEMLRFGDSPAGEVWCGGRGTYERGSRDEWYGRARLGRRLLAFEGAYLINARAMLHKAYALSGAVRPGGAARPVRNLAWKSQAHGHHLGFAASDHLLATPLQLQLMYAAAREGARHVDQYVGDSSSGAPVDGCFDARTQTLLRWRGSGKHPGRWVTDRQVCDAMGDLFHMGLLDADLAPTDAGMRFLDILPAKCEDPDVLCRWEDPEADPVEAGIAMDRWILTYFRAAKRAVNKAGGA